jgi:diguanylate cyclase (GGDEF)-like protein
MSRENAASVTRRLAVALGALVHAQGASTDAYVGAARALALALHYRWAYVTTLDRGSRRVRVVGSWLDGAPGPPFTYDLTGTPCEHVVATRAFVCIPERLTELFPRDAGLAKLGARAYAGDVYCGADGALAGHVFAVSDRSEAESDLARECTRLVTAWVGREVQHAALHLARATALREARTDALTGARNRKAFDEELAAVLDRGDDALLVLIDLEGFKQINDTLGHATGDRILRRFRAALGARLRSADRVYRVGGDEFVVLITRADPATNRAVRARIALAIDDVRADGFPSFGASVGAASAHEASSRRAFFALADQRMYVEKRRRRGRVRIRSTG